MCHLIACRVIQRLSLTAPEIQTSTRHAYPNLLPRLRCKNRHLGYSSDYVQPDPLLLHGPFHILVLMQVWTNIEPRFLLDLFVRGKPEVQPSQFRYEPRTLPSPTSRIAHGASGSSLLIFPFGNPHPELCFQPFTNSTCERTLQHFFSSLSTPMLLRHTLSIVSFKIIAPQTGTRTLYSIKVVKAFS